MPSLTVLEQFAIRDTPPFKSDFARSIYFRDLEIAQSIVQPNPDDYYDSLEELASFYADTYNFHFPRQLAPYAQLVPGPDYKQLLVQTLVQAASSFWDARLSDTYSCLGDAIPMAMRHVGLVHCIDRTCNPRSPTRVAFEAASRSILYQLSPDVIYT